MNFQKRPQQGGHTRQASNWKIDDTQVDNTMMQGSRSNCKSSSPSDQKLRQHENYTTSMQFDALKTRSWQRTGQERKEQLACNDAKDSLEKGTNNKASSPFDPIHTTRKTVEGCTSLYNSTVVKQL